MPRPVEALPWGSRSTINTFSPTAASAVPRLIAVVVFPTPPFWLAIARMRGGCGTLCAAGSMPGGTLDWSDMTAGLAKDWMALGDAGAERAFLACEQLRFVQTCWFCWILVRLRSSNV